MSQPHANDWVDRYSASHQHPINRFCHTIGIPMIVIALVLGLASFGVEALLRPALALFVLGWALQFIGHWFEGKPPEFLSDWRFLFVGLNWWAAMMRGGV